MYVCYVVICDVCYEIIDHEVVIRRLRRSETTHWEIDECSTSSKRIKKSDVVVYQLCSSHSPEKESDNC